MTQIEIQKLPNCQREMETKVNRLMQTEVLPSFGASASLKTKCSIGIVKN